MTSKKTSLSAALLEVAGRTPTQQKVDTAPTTVSAATGKPPSRRGRKPKHVRTNTLCAFQSHAVSLGRLTTASLLISYRIVYPSGNCLLSQ